MPLSEQDRILDQRGRPRIVSLWKALTALRSVVSFMNTGAHPDDETSAMLAAMRFRDGIDISFACSTRGEGGQNDVGTQTGAALGALRTAEMEAACDALDMRMYWLSEGPDDPITDFGFSKSGVETLGKWGQDRTMARFVHIIRRERPDIICPTFLDVPGQHGHHRAMTEAAHRVMDAAADPSFEGCDLPVWQVKKMYLPAWSGAGQAYDDDLPPPPATITVAGKGRDPVTGWSYEHIGQHSRVKHATQGMGRWVPRGEERDFPLHLADGRVEDAAASLTSGLPQTLRDIGAQAAQDACDAAIAAFPDVEAVLRHACAAYKALPQDSEDHRHKFDRKRAQLAQVIHLAAGVDVYARLENDVLTPNSRTAWAADAFAAEGDLKLDLRLPEGWQSDGEQITLGPDARTSDPYPDTYLPYAPDAPCVDITLCAHGLEVTRAQRFEVSPVVLPTRAARLTVVRDIINRNHARRTLTVTVADISPRDAVPELEVPSGWTVDRDGATFTVTAPQDVACGCYTLALTLDREPAQSVEVISAPHVATRVLAVPATVTVQVIEAQVPRARVGYIGGGHDRVGHWLGRMGADVVDLSQDALTEGKLAEFDTLVIGIFAMRARAGLSDAMPLIHDWTRAGGTLVSLYHRPWDNWDAKATAPYRLEIGQPSLRWRVTDETAQVNVLKKDHPVLTTPNRIGTADWAGWHKERGLYFAKAWDDAYLPLLSMHDADEAPLEGAMLVADVGAGRHIHTSLILHHQMAHLVPGAFRLMANLIASRV